MRFLPLRIIDRYLLGQFVQVFFICFVSLTGLYIVFDAFAHLDEFIEFAEKNGNLLEIMGGFYAYRAIYFFDKTSGLLALVAAMFTVTWIRRHNELTALMAAGISRGRVVRPIVIAAALVSVVAAANREVTIPQLRNELSRSSQDLGGNKAQPLRPRYDNETAVLINGRATIRAAQQIDKPRFILPPALAEYGNEVIANSAVYVPADPNVGRPAGYLMSGVQKPDGLAARASVLLGERPILLTPHDYPDWLEPSQCLVASHMDFEQLALGSASRQFASTFELIRGLRNPSLDFGADVRVAIHTRMVQPLLDVTLLFLGLPLVLRRDTGNLFLAMGICLVAVAVFMLVVIGCQYLGSIMLIGTATAAWLPLVIFVPLAAYFSDPFRE